MFEQALRVIAGLPESHQAPMIARLSEVSLISHNFGYGVGDDMDYQLAKYMKG